jgi:probable rRNA maturation factor
MSTVPVRPRDAVAAIDILVDHRAGSWDAEGAEALTRRVIAAALERGSLALPSPAELSLVLTDDAGIRELNRVWRGKDAATDVLSFPLADAGPGEDGLLGDIVLSSETIAREAEALAVPYEHHLAHLILHGVLHLFGYDHQIEEEAAQMERLETDILARLGIPDPWRRDIAGGGGSP